MKRIDPETKICNSCRFQLPLTDFYETRNQCKVCQRAKELKQLGRRLNIQPLMDKWRR